MASFTFNSFYLDQAQGNIIPGTDTFWAMLIDAAGVAAANKKTHTRRSDLTAYEITATGYTSGGKVITCSLSLNNVSDQMVYTFPSISWAGFTGSAAGMIIYKRRGGAASADNLAHLNDFGGVITLAATPLVVADSINIINNPTA